MAVTAPPASAPQVDRLAPVGIRAPSTRPGSVLLAALLAVTAYAVFAGGAVSEPAAVRLQVAIAVLAIATTGVGLWHGRLPLTVPLRAWVGLGLLAAFAAWIGASLAWSATPSASWQSLNRAIAYVVIVGLALAAGSWAKRPVERLAAGLLALVTVVALYALGGKLAPVLDVGFVDLDHTARIAVLRAPLQYSSALGLLCAMAAPVALRGALEATITAGVRVAALCVLALLIATVGLSASLPAVIALLFALGATAGLAGDGRRALLMTALAVVAVVPALVVGLSVGDLTANGVALGERQDDGLLLAVALGAGLGLLAVVGAKVLRLEAASPPDIRSLRLIRWALAGLVLTGVLVQGLTIGLSDRGLPGSASDAWQSLTRTQVSASTDPVEVLSASTRAANRPGLWPEAVGAWWDRPLLGWGAGSYPIVHRLYRANTLDVRQPHSTPLQFLAETGLAGAVLAVAGLLLLVSAALAARRALAGRERGFAAALTAGALTYLVHSLYEWDWEIPGATIPALVALGVVAARGGSPSTSPAMPIAAAPRLFAVAAAAVALSLVALSAIFPAWARSMWQGALASAARDPGAGGLERAADRARLAIRIDPLSVEALLAASSIAARRGSIDEARGYLVEATRRQPDDAEVWLALAEFDQGRGDSRGNALALSRARELDPWLVVTSPEVAIPPAQSATAGSTPLARAAGAQSRIRGSRRTAGRR
jgi:hypothetical protein